jgi:hypothetical protein
MNTTLTDIATALTGSLSADGQTPLSGNLNANSNKITNLTNPSSAQDGATKYYVDNAPYLQGATGSVSRTVTNKLQEIVSVLDFGADPTGATSSTTAFQNALNYCQIRQGSNYGGQTLFIPSGIYKIGALNLFNTNIQGESMFSTTLIYNGVAGGTMFTRTTGGANLSIKDLRFTDSLNLCGCYYNGSAYGQDFGEFFQDVYFDSLISSNALYAINLGELFNAYWLRVRFAAAPIVININQTAGSSQNRLLTITDWTIDFSDATFRIKSFIQLNTGGASSCTIKLENARVESSNPISNGSTTDAFVKVINTTGTAITEGTPLTLKLIDVNFAILGTATVPIIYTNCSANYIAYELNNCFMLNCFTNVWSGTAVPSYFPPIEPPITNTIVNVRYNGFSTDKGNFIPAFAKIGNSSIISLPISPTTISAPPGSLYIQEGQPYNNLYLKQSGSGTSGWTLFGSTLKGTTANRPSGSTVALGQLYLDTTLAANGKPIFWNGSLWVDYSGASV